MSETTEKAYQVLARKYRPQTFADLIGQEVMVRTLRNAFASDRIAHAFVLTGVRGVGKTTTARIVAKGLNCIGPDGSGGPTIEPCGLCGPCRAITEGRHVDVMEYDAASNTQVDKMRDILASLPYRPTEARYKIIIFDEVHMLSPGSFNALLKTLEEPPAHVKFIFATTEIRKVPVTILSRCQRFDLRRIEPEVMLTFLSGILAREGAKITDDALRLIVRASEGSARDALSLMDQAIAHGGGETGVTEVRAMLGLADRGRILDLFDMILKGEAANALNEISAQYAEGADPLAILRDLAEVTHWVSVIKITPAAVDDPTVSPDERSRGQGMAATLPMRVLSRMWQMLLKAIEEVSAAPNAMMAAEMAVIRLTHVAELPDPEQLLRRMAEGNAAPAPAPASAPNTPRDTAPALLAPLAPPRAAVSGGAATAVALEADIGLSRFATFDSVVDLIRAQRDMKLLVEVETNLRLVRYAPGRIEFAPTARAPRDLAATLSQRLQAWTGARWGVSVVSDGGAPTIAATRDATLAASCAEGLTMPLVQAVLAAFPQARITAVRSLDATPSVPAGDAVIPDDDAIDPDWDPFDDD